nr:uncharacterized membrane protein At3g27390 [Ipomoea batatas]
MFFFFFFLEQIRLFKSYEVNGRILLHEGCRELLAVSRIPTFRRRFKNLGKLSYMEAIEIGLIVSYANIEGATKSGQGNGSRCSNGRDDSKDGNACPENELGFQVNGNVV